MSINLKKHQIYGELEYDQVDSNWSAIESEFTQQRADINALDIQHNLSATGNPGATNDANQGYSAGSRWVNTAASPVTFWLCLDATAGSAVWHQEPLAPSELGSAALADLTTSATDTANGRVTKVGDLGWHSKVALEVADPDLNIGGGFFKTNNETNTPPQGGSGVFSYLRAPGANGNHSVDIGAFTAGGDGGGGHLSWRKKWQGGHWGWYKLFDSHNVLGNVSESGGVPTGALFDLVETAAGDRLKLPNGLMIAWHEIILTQGNSSRISAEWSYPTDFIDFPLILPSFSGGYSVNFSPAKRGGTGFLTEPVGDGTSAGRIIGFSDGLYTGGDEEVSVGLMAIGRWTNAL